MALSIQLEHRSPRRRGFTLVELLVVIAIIGVLVALLLPAVQAAREAARRSQCTNNLRNVGLAVLNYADVRGRMPAAATFLPKGELSANPARDNGLMFNWAIDILPYMEQQGLHKSFIIDPANDIKLFSDENKLARGTEIPIMLCPSDGGQGQPFQGSGGNWARGNYGLNAMQWYPNAFMWPNMQTDPFFDFNIGMAGFSNGVINQGQKLAQITDGTSNTIMLAEMRVGLGASDRRGTWAMGLCASNYHCRHAGFPPNACGGAEDDTQGVADIIKEVGEGTLKMECMLPDASVPDSGQSVVRSRHPGGAHVAMADGSARFISDFIEYVQVSLGPKFDDTENKTSESKFVAWQRLNVSRDGMTVGAAQ
ncbi:DUF1559 domain-containing protein [Lacipirellula parvula]|uniref:DUF1559 domain-containing protein n=1 Tax=Lacipirellula parvula TaxID=2650471 RepID=A0A5K7X5Z8_9BACT|nr:DUF1559 domain-containing protein [Lacipirellula parvula]BBO32174.1 hypothetical protein PLANPX_1786 [Lacipirellula parvula]